MSHLCIWCPSPATHKRGEHVIDDWVNREGGKRLPYHYTFQQFGRGGKLIREYSTGRIDVTRDVVCDPCNHGWMSDITNASKAVIEPLVRREEPATLLRPDIQTITDWLFMKAAIVGTYTKDLDRFFLPSTRHAFATNREIPPGLQIWVACLRSRHRMLARLWSDTIGIKSGAYKGYEFYLFTYVIGHFATQLTFLRWTKRRRKPPIPPIHQASVWNRAAIPIWPSIDLVHWPPAEYLTDVTLEDFRDRFTKDMHSPRSLE